MNQPKFLNQKFRKKIVSHIILVNILEKSISKFLSKLKQNKSKLKLKLKQNRFFEIFALCSCLLKRFPNFTERLPFFPITVNYNSIPVYEPHSDDFLEVSFRNTF